MGEFNVHIVGAAILRLMLTLGTQPLVLVTVGLPPLAGMTTPEVLEQPFEWAAVGWSSITHLRTTERWDAFAEVKSFRPLPPHQQLRHRRTDKVIFLTNGCGATIKYKQVDHENLQWKPTWCLYQAKDGHTVLVKPKSAAAAQGTRYFTFEWCRQEKTLTVHRAFVGGAICQIPGKWGPGSEMGKAG